MPKTIVILRGPDLAMDSNTARQRRGDNRHTRLTGCEGVDIARRTPRTFVSSVAVEHVGSSQTGVDRINRAVPAASRLGLVVLKMSPNCDLLGSRQALGVMTGGTTGRHILPLSVHLWRDGGEIASPD